MLAHHLLQIVRNAAPIAERNKRLTTEQLDIIYDQQWFNILAPKQYGGLELPLPEAVKLEEDISYADGSMGWVVTLCAGASWFGGFLNPVFAEEIFSDKKACLAGSGAPTGTAEKTDNGYIINGRWMHASGAPDATVFTANCFITANGNKIKDELGADLILSFTFLKEEVNILPTWNCMGMVATASNAYEVKKIQVGRERSFKIDADAAYVNSPLYCYPFQQLAEVTLSANMSGMALHFLRLCEEILSKKKTSDGKLLIDISQINNTYTKACNQLNTAREQMFNALENSWNICVKENRINSIILQAVSTKAYELVYAARTTVDTLYPYCGLSAADQSTEINRVWRDFHTASQHTLLALGGIK